MKTRTNTSNVARNTRTATLGIALAGLALALSPIASLADGGTTGIASGTVTTTRPVHGEIPVKPGQISPDFNRSGLVDIDDLFDYLTAWFAGKITADTNLNGVLELQDVLDYVNLWMAAYGTNSEDPRQ